tara:strand:- start:53 stop:535 length:483 start_codon:yes stop_codon:yes gene_type:complete
MNLKEKYNYSKEPDYEQLGIPNTYAQYHDNRWAASMYTHDIKCGVLSSQKSCPECGKRSPRHILPIEVLIGDIENNVEDYQQLLKIGEVVYRKKNHSFDHKNDEVIVTSYTIGFWLGNYRPFQYGNFCTLSCCQRYANKMCERMSHYQMYAKNIINEGNK